jgi:hypothetical protein
MKTMLALKITVSLSLLIRAISYYLKKSKKERYCLIIGNSPENLKTVFPEMIPSSLSALRFSGIGKQALHLLPSFPIKHGYLQFKCD